MSLDYSLVLVDFITYSYSLLSINSWFVYLEVFMWKKYNKFMGKIILNFVFNLFFINGFKYPIY